MIGYDKKSRRHFLLGASQFALALPFLGSLVPEKAWAGVGKKKFLAVCQTNGVRFEHWEPSLAPNQNFADVRVRSMSDFASGGVNRTMGTTFNGYLSKMTYIKGLDVVAGRGHNPCDVPMGNFQVSDQWNTIDQVMATSTRFYQGEIPAMNSLVVSFGSGGMSARWIGGSYVAIPPIKDPEVLFDRIFFSTSPTDKTRNLKIVDRVLASYNKAKGNPRLSAEDKQKMQNFIDLLSQTENRIRGQRALQVSKPAPPVFDENSTKQRYQALNDCIVLALAAEATQVVSYKVERIPYLTEADAFANPAGLDGRGVWHEDHHLPDTVTEATANPGDKATMNRILTYNQWWAQHVIFDLVKKLDSVTEANGKTILDNSLVYWGNEISYGLPHANFNQPVVLFGSAGGAMQTGRYLDYSRMNLPKGMPTMAGEMEIRPGRMFNQFLVSVFQTMGLTPADYERPGRKGYGVITSAKPEQNKLYEPVFAQHDQMLPRFRG